MEISSSNEGAEAPLPDVIPAGSGSTKNNLLQPSRNDEMYIKAHVSTRFNGMARDGFGNSTDGSAKLDLFLLWGREMLSQALDSPIVVRLRTDSRQMGFGCGKPLKTLLDNV